jgi:hypothetical protein
MANNSEEGQGSQRSVVPVMMMMMMMMMMKFYIYVRYLERVLGIFNTYY